MCFKACSEEHGFHEAMRLRDSGAPIPGSKRQLAGTPDPPSMARQIAI